MRQQQTALEVTEELEDFQNQTTRCFRPHCKPNKQILEHLSMAHLYPIDSLKWADCEYDTRSKVSDPLDFPYSAIGFLSLKYGQNKYRASGFLIGPNIVLTAACNLYIHSLQKECEEVKFYPGLHCLIGRECNVKKFYYPPQYKSSKPYEREEYNFAILELSEDTGLEYGYFGVDFRDNKQNWFQESVHVYGYPECVFENKIQRDARHCMYGDSGKWVKESENRLTYKIPTSAGQSGSPIYIKEAQDSYSVVGIHTDRGIASNSGLLLNNNIKAITNKWIKKIIKSLTLYEGDRFIQWERNIGAEGTKFLSQANWPRLTQINLMEKNIGVEGAKFLSQANWPSLTQINLRNNKISAEGAKYLSQSHWPSLTDINLRWNNIGAEGAKFLSQANWPQLTQIHLQYNNIGAEGAKFLSQANWPLLAQISLEHTKVGTEGAKFLSQAHWPSLTKIDLRSNNIGAEGAMFLSQANWPWLTKIYLAENNIGAEGAKFLSQANWPRLTAINLWKNKIGAFGESFLRSVQWSALRNFRIQL